MYRGKKYEHFVKEDKRAFHGKNDFVERSKILARYRSEK